MEVINKNKAIFAQSVKDLTGCNTTSHRIYLTNGVPVRSKPYRTLYALRQELKQQIDDLLGADIITPLLFSLCIPSDLGQKEKWFIDVGILLQKTKFKN